MGPNEFMPFLVKTKPWLARKAMNLADQNNDNAIQLGEFLEAMKRWNNEYRKLILRPVSSSGALTLPTLVSATGTALTASELAAVAGAGLLGKAALIAALSQ